MHSLQSELIRGLPPLHSRYTDIVVSLHAQCNEAAIRLLFVRIMQPEHESV